MSKYQDFLTESKALDQYIDNNEYAKTANYTVAKNVNVVPDGQLFRLPGYGREQIATVEQKGNTSINAIFAADAYSKKEFGKNVFRISTPLSNPNSNFHRSIVRIDVKKGKMAFLNQEKYEAGVIKWERPLMFRQLGISDQHLREFGL